MRRLSFRTLLLLLLGMLHVLATAQVFNRTVTPWPLIPDPPRSSVELVSADMRTNGIPMRVWVFKSTVSLEEVQAYYEAHWNQADPAKKVMVGGKRVGAVVKKLGPDEVVVASIHGPFYLTVKIKRQPFGASNGHIAISNYGESDAGMNVSGLVLPSGARAFSVVESADEGRVSKLATMLTKDSPQAVQDFYTRTLPANGWVLLDRHAAAQLQNGQTGSALFFSKNATQFSVLIASLPQSGSTVFQVNSVEAR